MLQGFSLANYDSIGLEQKTWNILHFWKPSTGWRQGTHFPLLLPMFQHHKRSNDLLFRCTKAVAQEDSACQKSQISAPQCLLPVPGDNPKLPLTLPYLGGPGNRTGMMRTWCSQTFWMSFSTSLTSPDLQLNGRNSLAACGQCLVPKMPHNTLFCFLLLYQYLWVSHLLQKRHLFFFFN